MSTADELKKLKELLDDGVLNKDEFEAQKKLLLNSSKDKNYDEWIGIEAFYFFASYFFINIYERLTLYSQSPASVATVVFPIMKSMERSIGLLQRDIKNLESEQKKDIEEIYNNFLKEFEIQKPAATKMGIFSKGPWPKILEETADKIDLLGENINKNIFEDSDWEDASEYLMKKYEIPPFY